MYKADVSNTVQCRRCPVNSTTDNVGSAFCECIYGTVRDLSRPQDDCQDIDTFVRQSKYSLACCDCTNLKGL